MPRPAIAFALAALTAASAGCEAVDARPTPAATLNFPITVALSVPSAPGAAPGYLLVGNADFDLRFDQGSIQSFDLAEIERRVEACAPDERPCAYEALAQAAPGVAGSTALLVDEVLVGAHMGAIAVSPRGDRLYVPSRSESGLTWIDFDPNDGTLACEDTGAPARCGAARRSTRRSDACSRSPGFVGDPVGAVAARVSVLTGDPAHDAFDYVIVAHRGGHASLFIDEDVGGRREPVLVHQLDGIPIDLTNVSLDPETGVAWANSSTVNQGRRTRDIVLLGVDYDPMRPACSAAFSAGRVFLAGIDDGLDTRDVGFSPGGRYVHVLSRRPEAVATLDLWGRPLSAGEFPITALDPVGFGPSRMDVAQVGGRTILAISCFDGRNVWIFDADAHRLLGVVPGFSGPFELVIDAARELLVVADFRDSVLRVVDLSPIGRGEPPELALRLGVVRPVSVLR